MELNINLPYTTHNKHQLYQCSLLHTPSYRTNAWKTILSTRWCGCTLTQIITISCLYFTTQRIVIFYNPQNRQNVFKLYSVVGVVEWWPGSFSLILVMRPFFGGAPVVSYSVSLSCSKVLSWGSTEWAVFLWPGSISLILVTMPSFLGTPVSDVVESRPGSDAESQDNKQSHLISKEFSYRLSQSPFLTQKHWHTHTFQNIFIAGSADSMFHYVLVQRWRAEVQYFSRRSHSRALPISCQ